MKLEQLAQAIAERFDGDYDDGLEAFLGAHVDGGSVVIEAEPEQGAVRKFRAVLVEIEEAP